MGQIIEIQYFGIPSKFTTLADHRNSILWQIIEIQYYGRSLKFNTSADHRNSILLQIIQIQCFVRSSKFNTLRPVHINTRLLRQTIQTWIYLNTVTKQTVSNTLLRTLSLHKFILFLTFQCFKKPIHHTNIISVITFTDILHNVKIIYCNATITPTGTDSVISIQIRTK